MGEEVNGKIVDLSENDRSYLLYATGLLVNAFENLAWPVVSSGRSPVTQLESDILNAYDAIRMFQGSIFIKTTPIHFKE